MTQKIIYIGNLLTLSGSNPTGVETLGVRLSTMYEVVSSSQRRNRLHRLLDMIWTVIRQRKDCKCVLIDTYSTSAFFYALIIGKLCQLFRLAYIPILHGGNLPLRLDRSPGFCRQFFGKAIRIVSPSGFLKEVFKNRGFDVEVIPNFLNLDNYPYFQRKKVHADLLWVRAFHEIYNPAMALEVLELILQKFDHCSLCMVGPEKDDSMKKFKAQIQKKGLQGQVQVTGKLPKEEWIEKSQNFDFFLNTTHVDNTPVSVMEAMALGMCVISTNVGGMPWLVEDGVDGILCEDEDAQSMANAIIKLIQTPQEASTLSENARKKAEKMDWMVVKQQWKSILESVEEKR